MNKLLKYLPFHFLICLVLGIGIQNYFVFWEFGFQKLLIVLFFFVCGLLFFLLLKKAKAFTCASIFVFIFLGISVAYFHDDRNYANYYAHFKENNATAIFTIDKVLKSNSYYDNYVVTVSKIKLHHTKGKLLFHVKKDSLVSLLTVDTRLLLQPLFKAVKSPLNPHQFNYKVYLEKQHVYEEVFVDNSQFKIVNKQLFSLAGFSAKFRERIKRALQEYHFSNDEFGVVNALLLGQRKDISKELLNDYANAGAIHILAVSGLHVGVILWLLAFLLKPLEKLKHGIVIKTFFIVLLLWMFAFIAGLSASVVRAVTMFSFVAIGLISNRKRILEYSLITSMFLLLLMRPSFLFDVGFQLSYLAVFSIAWVQPVCYNLWRPKQILYKKIWQLFTVSIAAQLGVFPLSLYYFHQFPSLFILSSLFIIPCLGIILLGGIFIIILALCNLLPVVFAEAYGQIISVMNSFVHWVSQQEGFLFTDISLSFLLMFAVYLVLVFAFRFFIKRNPKRLLYFFATIILWQTGYLIESFQKVTKKEFIVFHKYKKSVIGIRKSEILTIYHDIDSLATKRINFLEAYKIGEGVALKYEKLGIPNMMEFNKQQFLIVDKLGVYKIKGLTMPMVILKNSPKINLLRLINVLKPKIIIADGSNYNNDVARWKETCAQEKTPFYSTSKNGAFIYKD